MRLLYFGAFLIVLFAYILLIMSNLFCKNILKDYEKQINTIILVIFLLTAIMYMFLVVVGLTE